MADESFDDFFRREYVPLIVFLRKSGFDQESAEDAAAETMTRACQCWSALNTPTAWVRTAALRCAIANARRQRDGLARVVAADRIREVHHDTGRHAEIEEGPAIDALLDMLPPQQRQVMVWRLEGLGSSEIAVRMELKDATVRSHLRHARDTLKSQLMRFRPDLVRRDPEAAEGGKP